MAIHIDMSERDPTFLNSESTDIAADLAAIQPRLYGFILKRLADREQTLEVLQRTNLVICEKADEFSQGSSFVAWAFTIAKFQVMAWRKLYQRERLVFTDAVSELLDRSPEAEAAAVDRRIPSLRRCIERLRTADQELVKRRYRDGEQIQHVAKILGKSVDVISMRLMRIRRQLADCVAVSLKTSDGNLGDAS